MRRHIEEQRLRKALRQYTVPVPRPEQKAMTKLLASKALANKPLTQGKPFLQRLRELAAYISPTTWSLQAMVLLLVLSGLTGSNAAQLLQRFQS